MKAFSPDQSSLPFSSDELLEVLRGWGLEYDLYSHCPLKTVEDAKMIEQTTFRDGKAVLRIKNLYLRDKKKRNYLVTLEQDRVIDLKDFGAKLKVGNLSFGSPGRLLEFLGVSPGAVTPLAMINGSRHGVRFFMDDALLLADWIYMHPLVNDRTIAMKRADVLTFFERINAKPEWI